jgi:lysophospholipase L1-like esterase
MPLSRASSLAVALALVLLAGLRPAQADYNSYIALGDSLAFGEYRFQNNPSNGDRGYVAPFADRLTSLYGSRPAVINLAVDGETSGTFVNGGQAVAGDGSSGQPGYSLNTHYTSPYPSQNQLLLATLGAESAAGHNVGMVTLQLGANDLFLLAGSSSFQALSPAEQYAAIVNTLNGLAANDAQILTEIKALAPHATVVMMGYYDPYGAFVNDPNSPFYAFAQLTHIAIPALNQTIASVASAFGDPFINPYPLFVGNELAYTDIATGNVHPNDLGYGVIAGLLAPVPEPSSLLSLGLGVGAAILGGVWRIRRRRQPAA